MNPRELIVRENESYIEVDSQNDRVQAPVDFYSDYPSVRAPELDVIEQLNANIAKIDELYGRLQFVLGEVKHVITRR